jgi:hypothetical protein
MHCRHHKLQHRVDDRTRLFGIEVLHQLGRALNVANSAVTVFSPSVAVDVSGCSSATLISEAVCCSLS